MQVASKFASLYIVSILDARDGIILGHEQYKNSWSTYLDQSLDALTNVFFITQITRRVKTVGRCSSGCTRQHATGSGGRAVERSRGQLVLMGGENQGGVTREYENGVEVSSGIEDYIPSGKGKSRFGRVE